ncbi:L,D-transpeptidase family protein [Acinetobacter nectaris]|uniref:L,D-transpeptidase family protein n=1 Tax=Acinetobacter nectaris TaxID=1219382 RepID=UPI001F2EF13D|nr:L,D-transpeptidase family protein [Acinetobacter nectaris]MCF8998922.1 murein L,D-transpeptidase [Acinetobacter nectaris]MCF9027485.1 murein L,D-transpeptidase [Acinetobacter nectaris]
MFVRSLLAVSLSYLMINTAFAASDVAQSATGTSEQVASTPAATDPIDPLSLDNKSASEIMAGAADTSASDVVSASEAQITTQEQNNLNDVAKTVKNIDNTPDKSTTKSATKFSKTAWTLENLNNVEWYSHIGKGQFPIYARAQVMLNNAHASPGAIDGSSGKNTLKAIASFQQMHGIQPTGVLDEDTWNALLASQGDKPAYIEYTISEDDLKGPYAKEIPHDYALQAKMKGLYYTSVPEMLGEKFHMDEGFLKQLNPKANFNQLGQKIIVTSVRNNLPENIHLIVAHKGAKQLYLFNAQNQMVGSFPATIGSSDTPSPTGSYKVVGVTPNPWYSYSPSNFVQGNNLKPLSLPPGPNAPVGNIWIGLSKKSFGIHGTPYPSLVSKTASHGCIRLTNWDANDLGRKVKSGTIVKFLE